MYFLLHQYSIDENSQICFLGQYNVGINIPQIARSYLSEKKIDENKLLNILDKSSYSRIINDGIIIPENVKEYNRTGKKVLVVQPHSDDFVLSCGGTILKLLEEDNIELHLLTIFTKQNFDSSPWKNHILLSNEEYTKLRLMEDINLCKYLKCDYSYLGFEDISERNGKRLISKAGLLKKDIFLKDKLKHTLINRINKINPEEIYVPLGIGYHIDHLITTAATIDIIKEMKCDFDIYFYEDYPYCNYDKKTYWHRISEVQNLLKVSPVCIDVSNYLRGKALLINFYKSQFISNRLVVFKEDVKSYARAVSIETNYMIDSDVPEYAERIWKFMRRS